MVAAGPSPGRMPITVPRKQPTKHQNRLSGCSATAKPCRRPCNISISEPEHALRQRDAERQRECEIEDCNGADRRERGGEQRLAEHHTNEEKRECSETDDEAQRVHERNRD